MSQKHNFHRITINLMNNRHLFLYTKRVKINPSMPFCSWFTFFWPKLWMIFRNVL
ncbi:Uncharacterised protein [Vibrio cholerae]|nr:Uncharacterised protein [Vibrio cholerae]